MHSRAPCKLNNLYLNSHEGHLKWESLDLLPLCWQHRPTLLSCSFITTFLLIKLIKFHSFLHRKKREFWTQCVKFFCTRVVLDEAVDAGLGVGVLVNTIVSCLVIPYFSVNTLGELQEEDEGYNVFPLHQSLVRKKTKVCRQEMQTFQGAKLSLVFCLFRLS